MHYIAFVIMTVSPVLSMLGMLTLTSIVPGNTIRLKCFSDKSTHRQYTDAGLRYAWSLDTLTMDVQTRLVCITLMVAQRKPERQRRERYILTHLGEEGILRIQPVSGPNLTLNVA